MLSYEIVSTGWGHHPEQRLVEIEDALKSGDNIDKEWALNELNHLPEAVTMEIKKKFNIGQDKLQSPLNKEYPMQ